MPRLRVNNNRKREKKQTTNRNDKKTKGKINVHTFMLETLLMKSMNYHTQSSVRSQ